MDGKTLTVNIKKKLHDFQLSADWSERGNITCLFGYTGSGKSLTLKMIAGLIKPDSGNISFGDKTFFDSSMGVNIPPQRRGIGYVSQSDALFPHMTLYQNILYGLDARGGDRVKRVKDIISVLRLETLEQKYPHQISGGQRQRTAIARAVIRNPKLLLLDEPFNSLDHAVRKKMYNDLLRYQKYFAVPIILVTHDIDELNSLANWVVLYNDGGVVQAGAPEDVFSRPVCRVSARLVGTKNILDGDVISVDGGCVKIKTDRGVIYVNHTRAAAGYKVICCIRPENIAILRNGSAPGDYKNVIKGTVSELMRCAAFSDLFIRIADNNYDFEIRVNNDDFAALKLCKGKEVNISIDAGMVHLIPAG